MKKKSSIPEKSGEEEKIWRGDCKSGSDMIK